MSAQKLDAVLPLTLKDYARFEILHKSLKLFFKDLGKCWIVTPDHEFERIKSLISDEQCYVIPESSLVPEFKIFRSSSRFSLFKSVPGWFKQQIIKIAIADRIETDFYLTLDADVICTKPIYFQDLVKDGRAVCHIHQTHDHHDWYGWAENVLKMTARNRDLLHNVTPAVLSKQGMLELQSHLTQVYQKSRFSLKPRNLRVIALKLFTTFLSKKSSLRRSLLSWKSYLSVYTPWTEYGLYYIFLEETNRFDTYHVEVPDCLYTNENSVWYEGSFESWDVEKAFDARSNHSFVIVQGWLNLDVKEVWQKVDRYLNEPYLVK